MYPKNLGYRISIDETCLSCGELYTIVTNKSAKGQKGAIIAIIRGVASTILSKILLSISSSKRKIVKEVTVDMSASLNKVIRTCFPSASVVIDRFHVQQLANEALQGLRIERRWQVLEEECDKTRMEKEDGKKYEAEKMENGDTLKQLLVRSKYPLMQSPEKWQTHQQERMKILFETFPEIKQGYNLVQKLRCIYNQKYQIDVARAKLARWYEDLLNSNLKTFGTVARTLENHNHNIINYFNNRSTNASAESFNAKIKQFRAGFRGVSDIPFFLFRLTNIYA